MTRNLNDLCLILSRAKNGNCKIFLREVVFLELQQCDQSRNRSLYDSSHTYLGRKMRPKLQSCISGPLVRLAAIWGFLDTACSA